MTMAFSTSPAYKTAKAQNACASAPSSGLASLLGSLIGGTSPAYKTLAGQSPQASASSGLLQIFVGGAPSYKTASQATNLDSDDGDTGDADDGCDSSCPPPTDTVIVL
jgi:hypothetical protein